MKAEKRKRQKRGWIKVNIQCSFSSRKLEILNIETNKITWKAMTPVYTCPTNTRSRNVPPTSFKEVVLSAWQISDFLNCLNYISRKLSVSKSSFSGSWRFLSVQIETELHLYNANSHPNTSNIHTCNANKTNDIAVAGDRSVNWKTGARTTGMKREMRSLIVKKSRAGRQRPGLVLLQIK